MLEKLKTAIDDPTLSDDDKKLFLQQLQSLAEAAKNPKDGEMQKKAKKALRFLEAISEGLEPAKKLVTIGKDIIPAITAFFGL